MMQSTTITRSKLEMMDLDLSSKTTSSNMSMQYSPKTVLDHDHGDSLERTKSKSGVIDWNYDAEDIFDVTDFLNADLLDWNNPSFDSVPSSATYWTESIDTSASAEELDSMLLNPLGWSENQNTIDQSYYYPQGAADKARALNPCDPARYGFGFGTDSMNAHAPFPHGFPACMKEENAMEHTMVSVQNNLIYKNISNGANLRPLEKGLGGYEHAHFMDSREVHLNQLHMGAKSKSLGKKRQHELASKAPSCPEQLTKKKQRSSFSRHATSVLKAWLKDNILNPYPTEAQKHQLTKKIGISMPQLQTWFINARIRLWKPCIEDLYKAKEQEINQLLKTKGASEAAKTKSKLQVCESENCDSNSANVTMQMIHTLQKLPNLKGPLAVSVNKFFA